MRYEMEMMGLPGKVENGVEYVQFQRTLMCDWDMPHVSHSRTSSVTIPHRGYVIGILNRDVCWRPDHVWEVYKTPAGVRAFLTSRYGEMKAEDLQLMEDLDCDPLYRLLAQSVGGWNCRVSPKPGRAGDFVAEYWMTVRGVRAHEDERALSEVARHEELCRRPHEQKDLVKVACKLCRSTVVEGLNGYVHLEKDYSCPLCQGKQETVLTLGGKHKEFLSCVERGRVEHVDLLQWSDLLEEDGLPEYAVENARVLQPLEIEVLKVGHGTPKPVVGQWTDWTSLPKHWPGRQF